MKLKPPGAWGGRCLSSFIIYVFQNCMQRSVSSQFYVAQVNVMCARTMFNMYVQFSLYRMASVPVSVITICRKVISPQLLEIMESGPNWIYAHCVTIYWWRAYHLVIFCSISWFLEVSPFWQFLQICWSLLSPQRNGVLFPLCQQVLDVSVSVVQQVVSKQAYGMPFCRRIWNCPTHISDYLKCRFYTFIGPYDYIYSSCSYIICCSRFWFYIHKRIRGAKNISSKQKCCS